MRSTVCFLALALLAATPLAAQSRSANDTVQAWYEQGRAAFFRDDLATAKRLLLRVNKADPKHQPTIILLKNIQLAEQAQAARNSTLEGRMRRLIIPTLDLTDAKVAEALEFLQLKAAELTPNGPKPNFILRVDAKTGAQTITLKLNKVSLHDALRAVAGAAGMEVVYDQFAVTIQPRSPEPSPAPSESPARK
jgi:hypothetical protein